MLDKQRGCFLGSRFGISFSTTAQAVANLAACRGAGRTLEAHTSTVAAITRALENAGVEFIDENGGGPGVRLRKLQRPKKRK